MLPDLSDFPHTDAPTGGRFYELRGDVRLFVIECPGSLPGAPDGALIYAFTGPARVGRWDWARDAGALRSVMETYRETTDPEYLPPERTAPGGERAMIRPPTRDALEKAIEAARPGGPTPQLPRAISMHLELVE